MNLQQLKKENFILKNNNNNKYQMVKYYKNI